MIQSRHIQNIDTDHEILRCVTDRTGRLLYVSPALTWVAGYTRRDLLQLDLRNVVRLYEKDGEEIALHDLRSGFYDAVIERLDRDPQLTSVRVDAMARNGEQYAIFWFDPTGDRFLNEETREKSERLLQQVENLGNIPGRAAKKSPRIENISMDEGELRHFINMSNEMFGIYRREGSFVRVNYAFNRVLGFTDQDLRKFPFLNLIHPEDRGQARRKVDIVMSAPTENETRVAFETRAICKDGECKWVEWTLKSAQGHIYIIGRDVTDIRLQEAELDARERQLSEAQKIGRMGHWSWDVGAREIDWSAQLYRIYGVEQSKFKPTFENINKLISSADIPDLYKYFQKIALEKRDYTNEFSIVTPDGETRYLRAEGRCHINERTGGVEKIFGIIQDITERTLNERQLHAAKDAAENAYASKTRFLANMSHELRTPLNAIIGFSEMMQRQLLGPIGNSKYLDYVGGIRESGEHLLDLINDILDMSKIEVGKYDLEFEQINLAKIIRLVLHMMEGRAHESEVRLISDNVAEDMHIYADRRAIMQVLLNLMSNAVKFTPAGGQVEVSCHKHGNEEVSIIVQDTGVGIPKSKIPVITRPFEQVASAMTRPHEGSGLGLAITKDLIELHKGEMKISSKVNRGTIVTVCLPVNENLAAPLPEAGETEIGDALDSGYAVTL